ncbi:MAG: ribulose-phosphate 3-epimerase [Deltaproteobacteria bacterium]|jgi:ribulose-phosphate 3-epimerase|nr:ribulose-phosphate 3-epimerase [Deltaproteobacteria bacterium]
MILSPSLLAADFGNLERELADLRRAGISWTHWDVMDGMFVPNITFGPPVIRRLRQDSALFFDVHLMIEAPERYLKDFAEAGADLLTVHAEASRHLDRTLREIRRLGMRAGLALNPSTPVSAVEEVLDSLDFILIMSVNPGFGGQSFIPRSLNKVRDLADLLLRRNSAALIGVDGGVDPDNSGELTRLGADVLISGSAFFRFPPYAERLAVFASASAAQGRAGPAALFGLIS